MQTSKNQQLSTKKLAVLALLSTLALISFLIEGMLPVLFPYMPYAKLGVANIFIMFAILVFGVKEGIIVAVTKLLLSAMITGNIYGSLYSACGLTLSILALAILLKFDFTTIIGKSIISSVCFNAGQVLFASVSLSQSLVAIMPLMLFCSLISGGIIGIAIKIVINKLPISFFVKLA